ncbi:MAG: hypothetical protein ACRDFQ_05475, partial [Anaerolineales bacterium]
EEGITDSSAHCAMGGQVRFRLAERKQPESLTPDRVAGRAIAQIRAALGQALQDDGAEKLICFLRKGRLNLTEYRINLDP